MIKKIISGGQTGADQAALDAAIKLDIPHGGWIPKGKITENGPLLDKYKLDEMSTSSYVDRTEQNVIDSDGTLIVSHGRLTGGSALTRELAMENGKHLLHIDLNKISQFDAAVKINTWIFDNHIEVLNVALPRASKDPEIYQAVMDVLKSTYYLLLVSDKTPDALKVPFSRHERVEIQPETVQETVELLIKEMDLKNKAGLSKLPEDDLIDLHYTMGLYVRNRFFYPRNDKLLESCREIKQDKFLHW